MNLTNFVAAYRYTRGGILLVIIILALFLTLSACGDRAPYAEQEADSIYSTVPAPPPPPITETNRVEVTLSEYALDMPDSVAAGPTVFTVANTGTEEHGFEIKGAEHVEALAMTLQPGEMTTVELDLEPGAYTVYCPVANHEESGMQHPLTVYGPDAGAI